MGNWSFNGNNLNSGNYDVAKSDDGTFVGTLYLPTTAGGDLDTANVTWTLADGTRPSPLSVTWNSSTGNLTWTAGNQPPVTYNVNCTWTGAPTSFEGGGYCAMFNQNAPWAYGNEFSVTRGNSANPNGTLVLSKDAAGNLSCVAAWKNNPNSPKSLFAVVRWDGINLSWSTEKYNDGTYVQGSNPARFTGVYNGASPSPTGYTGSWTAQQTNPMPKPVEDKPQVQKKAV